jgi:hypothetical protein
MIPIPIEFFAADGSNPHGVVKRSLAMTDEQTATGHYDTARALDDATHNLMAT